MIAIIGVLCIVALIIIRSQVKEMRSQLDAIEMYQDSLIKLHEEFLKYTELLEERNKAIYRSYCLISKALDIKDDGQGEEASVE